MMDKSSQRRFASLVRNARISKGLRQRDVADAAGIYWCVMSEIETGKLRCCVRAVAIVAIADCLGIDRHELLACAHHEYALWKDVFR